MNGAPDAMAPDTDRAGREPRTGHPVPTHLGVEDKLLYGLTARQFTLVSLGLAVGYNQARLHTAWPPGLRLALGLACVLVPPLLAWVRPGGRGLEAWAFAALRYAALPHRCTWQRRPVEPERDTEPGWADLPLDVPSEEWKGARGEGRGGSLGRAHPAWQGENSQVHTRTSDSGFGPGAGGEGR